MHPGLAAEIAALGLTLLVHVLGAGVLIWNMLQGDSEEDRPSWRDWWPGDDDGRDPGPETPPSGGSDHGLPLPDAVPAPVRLREPGRIGDHRPRPARRPVREPEPAPERTPAGR